MHYVDTTHTHKHTHTCTHTLTCMHAHTRTHTHTHTHKISDPTPRQKKKQNHFGGVFVSNSRPVPKRDFHYQMRSVARLLPLFQVALSKMKTKIPKALVRPTRALHPFQKNAKQLENRRHGGRSNITQSASGD